MKELIKKWLDPKRCNKLTPLTKKQSIALTVLHVFRSHIKCERCGRKLNKQSNRIYDWLVCPHCKWWNEV